MQALSRVLCLSLGLLSFSAAAQVEVSGPVEYGLFHTPYQAFEPGDRLLTQNNQTIEQTTEIPAKLGSRFGLRYSLSGKQAGDLPLTLLYLTPGVITPDGQRHDKIVVEQPLALNAVKDVMAFEFSEHYEVVPGEWEFLVFQGDRLLARQRFEVR